MGEIITTKQLSEGLNSESKIGNQTLSDLNSVLKTVDSILSRFGTSLGDIIKKRSENSNKQNPEAHNFMPMPVPTQQVQSSLSPTKERKFEIVINSDNAALDLIQRLEKLDDKDTLEKLKKDSKELQESGFLSTAVNNWMKGFVQIQEVKNES
jgi:hypothetical protein